ncbi:o-succinylbenzoate synthase [Hyphobacterium sp. CCMP332]|nr:o-succinylbenzoate synthase [Hyphobacterium sp. CCMP332]
MNFDWSLGERNLIFKFDAGTSRGIIKNKYSAFLKLHNEKSNAVGLGEAGPLKGLSEEFDEDLKSLIHFKLKELNGDAQLIEEFIQRDYQVFSSIKFAIESAFYDVRLESPFQIYKTGFFNGQQHIPINGLIWMGEYEFMKEQIAQKLNDGFECIKIKIGALDIDREMSLIHDLRKKFRKDKIEIRVDANGAFQYDEAREIMNELYKLDIHSIEQPIAVKNFEDMSRLARDSKLAIALDEELIGVREPNDKLALLKLIRPQFIVLKPSLHGGLYETSQWIDFAESQGIGWWITSALESNIGLNAISQFVSQYKPDLYQGLGTGKLFENNIKSPLTISTGKISYNNSLDWDLKDLEFKPL